MTEQNSLFEEKTANHAGRGMEFEAELDAVHRLYKIKGLIFVAKNPSQWDYARGKEHWKTKASFEKGNPTAARVGSGGYLHRVYSDVDYSGGNDKFGVAFDAKETKGDKFPLKNIEMHQIVSLTDSAKCGVISGALMKFTDFDRMFFVPAKFIDEKYIAWVKASFGRRRAPDGTAAIWIKEIEAEPTCREVFRDNKTLLWDWLKVFWEIHRERTANNDHR